MENSHAARAPLLAADLPLKWARRYETHTSSWVEAVAKCSDVSLVEAKKKPLKATYGITALPDERGVPRGPPPFAALLAADFAQAGVRLATKGEARRRGRIPKRGGNSSPPPQASPTR